MTHRTKQAQNAQFSQQDIKINSAGCFMSESVRYLPPGGASEVWQINDKRQRDKKKAALVPNGVAVKIVEQEEERMSFF